MPLDIELGDERIEPQVDADSSEAIAASCTPILSANASNLAQERAKEQRTLVGSGDFVAHEHDRPLLTVLADSFTCTSLFPRRRRQ